MACVLNGMTTAEMRTYLGIEDDLDGETKALLRQDLKWMVDGDSLV
jgi:hypothetical protein